MEDGDIGVYLGVMFLCINAMPLRVSYFFFFLIILSDIYGRKYGIVGYHMPDILGRIDGHHITVFYKVEAEFPRGAKC